MRAAPFVAFLALTGSACRPDGGSAEGPSGTEPPTIASSLESLSPLETAPPTEWNRLVDEGVERYYEGEYDAARAMLQILARRAAAAGDPVVEARALTWSGFSAWRQSEYPAAREFGMSALEVERAHGLDDLLSRTQNLLGLVSWHETKLDEAAGWFDRAVQAGRAAGDEGRVASAVGNLGLVRADLGDFDEAREAFEALRVAGAALQEPRRVANGLTNLGMLDILVGDPRSAIPRLEEARRIYREDEDPNEEIAVRQLAGAYAALGELGRAHATYDTALAMARDWGLPQAEAANLEELAELYVEAGDLRLALEHFQLARRLNASLGLALEEGRDLRGEGLIRLRQGDLGRAGRLLSEARLVHSGVGAPFDELQDLVLLAEVAQRNGADTEADRWLAEGRAIAARLGIAPVRVAVALATARVNELRGDPEGVLDALDPRTAALANSDFASEWEAHALRARAFLGLGRLEQAVEAGRAAVRSIERVRGSLGSAELRGRLARLRSDTYGDLSIALIRLGRVAEAFDVTDAPKGRGLLEHLGTADARAVGLDATASRIAESEALLRRIDQLSRSLMGVQDAGADEARDRARRLVAARSEYERLLILIQEEAPPRAAFLGAVRPSVSAVQSTLEPGEIVLAYDVLPDRFLTFAVDREGVVVAESNVGAAALATRVRLARDLLSRPGTSVEELGAVLEGLHRVLLDPIREQHATALADVERAFIVPDEILTYLPFSALRDSATGRYLVEEVELAYLPSAGSLPASRSIRAGRDSIPPAGLQAFAPLDEALPASRAEALAAAAADRGGRASYGTAATERAVRRALRDSRAVHLATHGVLNPRNPMFSRIELSPEEGIADADGRLEVHEVLSLAIRSHLVFLSGCETGLGGAAASGGTPAGEDYATLAQAFLYAGASSVVATLWPIEDQGAAAFAGHFYREAPSAGSPVTALSRAQRSMLRSGSYAAPFYWAAYRVAGAAGESIADPTSVDRR